MRFQESYSSCSEVPFFSLVLNFYWSLAKRETAITCGVLLTHHHLWSGDQNVTPHFTVKQVNLSSKTAYGLITFSYQCYSCVVFFAHVTVLCVVFFAHVTPDSFFQSVLGFFFVRILYVTPWSPRPIEMQHIICGGSSGIIERSLEILFIKCDAVGGTGVCLCDWVSSV